MTIKRALQTIKGYCEKHTTCHNCPLEGKLHCLLKEEVPADWDVEEILKKRRGDNNEDD